jgi:hypothetical protein
VVHGDWRQEGGLSASINGASSSCAAARSFPEPVVVQGMCTDEVEVSEHTTRRGRGN